MQEQKEKILEALKNVQTAIQELENYIGPNSHHNRKWIEDLTIRMGNIQNDLWRIDERRN